MSPASRLLACVALAALPLALAGTRPAPAQEPAPVLLTLHVDSEVFTLRAAEHGGTHYDWVSGPNPGYGFTCSAPPDVPEAEHRDAVRSFLAQVDPRTGYLAED